MRKQESEEKVKKNKLLRTMIAVILAIALIIASLVTHNQNLHSPKQMDIDLVGKTVSFDPDKYAYGCYYIELAFQVEAKQTGAWDIPH